MKREKLLSGESVRLSCVELFSVLSWSFSVFNGEKFLEKTITSVINQSCKDFEYIVIDGNSNDGSKEILKNHDLSIDYWVSEPDSGIYNAMNKGIRVAKGDYLLFLNSGDYLCDNDTIHNVAKEIDGSKDLYYGNAIFKRDTTDEKVIFPEKLTFLFFTHNSLCHQASFIRRSLFAKFFYYNEDFKIISDWEFIIYSVCIKNISYERLNIFVSYYNFDGISSNKDSKEIIRQETEIVMKKYFSAFIDDYKVITNISWKKFNEIVYIKQYAYAWKALKKSIKIILFFLPKRLQ